MTENCLLLSISLPEQPFPYTDFLNCLTFTRYAVPYVALRDAASADVWAKHRRPNVNISYTEIVNTTWATIQFLIVEYWRRKSFIKFT